MGEHEHVHHDQLQLGADTDRGVIAMIDKLIDKVIDRVLDRIGARWGSEISDLVSSACTFLTGSLLPGAPPEPPTGPPPPLRRVQ
jgi:hypothetical protein